jgi:hypothetical protein
MEKIEATHFIQNIEVRALVAHFPSADVPGYQIRFLVEAGGAPPAWTPWMFLSREYAAEMVKGFQKQFSAEGRP